jgi:ABC-type branched-subunit amino acid transport system substrate-binding protein
MFTLKARHALAVTLLLLAPLARGAEVPGITPDKILIGQTAGFTGTVAGGVKETTDGAKLYINWVNNNGGVHGRKIELVSMDDKFDPKVAAQNARALIEEKKVFALFLNRGTPHSEAILPLLKQYGVPLVGPSTGADLLHNPVNPYVFNVRAKYQLEAEKGIVQLSSMGMSRIGVIHVNDSFGKDALAGAMKGFAAANIKPSGVYSYDRATGKVDDAVKAALKTDAQATILIGSGANVADIVSQMRGAHSGMQLVTLSNNSSASFVKSLGDNARGVIVTQVFPNPSMATTGIALQMKKLSKESTPIALSHQAMEGFAAAKVLVEGLKRAGKNPTRAAFVAALDQLRDFDLGGMSLSYNPNDHTGTEYVELSMITRNGEFLQR